MFRAIGPHTTLAYLCLALIAMAGLAYANFLPGLVSALAGGIGFSEIEAGRIVALNGYGGILGGVGAVYLVSRVPWRPVLFGLLALLAALDLCTLFVANYDLMLGWRFCAGLIGGMCVGIAVSVVARLPSPDRAFGFLLLAQFSVGSIVVYLLPALESVLGAYAVFWVMAGFVTLSMLLLLILSDLPPVSESERQSISLARLVGNPFYLLGAILAYQTAASGIWAYIGLIGYGARLGAEDVSLYVATTGMLGLAGAMLPILNGKRLGRLFWVRSGVVLSGLAAIGLIYSILTWMYVLSMALLFFSWPAVLSYLFAVGAEMDGSGRFATLANVVSSLGLATGPLLASSMLGDGNYTSMLLGSAALFGVSMVLVIKPVRLHDAVECLAK